MKKRSKRAIALLLTLVMCLTLTPSGLAYAADEVFERITSENQLTDGYYVLGVEVDGDYASVGGRDPDRSTDWAAKVSIDTDGNTLEADLSDDNVWYVSFQSGEMSLLHPDDYYLGCSGTANGITFEESLFQWDYVFDSVTETAKLSYTADDEYFLALNKDNNGFRTYRNSTLTGSQAANYASEILLFKLDHNAPAPLPRAAAPSADPDSGTVAVGDEIKLTSSQGLDIHYTVDGVDPDEHDEKYTAPIAITEEMADGSGNITIKAIAADSGGSYRNSSVAVFHYRLPGESSGLENSLLASDVIDVELLSEGAVHIGQAVEDIRAGQAGTVTVFGEITYRFGIRDSFDSTIIQDVVSGETVALQIYAPGMPDFNIGDIIEITGDTQLRYGVPQISLSNVALIRTAEGELNVKPQTVTIAEAKSNYQDYISQVVLIEDVTLGAYDSTYTTVTDSTGNIQIYQGASYPAGVAEGEVVNLLAVVSTYNTSPQLRVGAPAFNNNQSCYIVANDTNPPVITLPADPQKAKVGVDYGIALSVTDNAGVDSVKISYKLNDSAYNTPEDMTLSQSNGNYEYTIPGNILTTEITSLTYKVDAVDINGLTASKESDPIEVVNEPIIRSVTPKGGSATGDDKRPALSISYENGSDTVVFSLTPRDGEMVIKDEAMEVSEEDGVLTATYTSDKYAADLADGRYTVNIQIGSYEYSWYFTVGELQHAAYFGQLHAHTAEYSDGAGTLAQALSYINNIPDSDNVQFVAFTDHSNYFDSTSAANPPEALYDASKMTDASRLLWEKYVGDMRSFNEADNGILAIPGFEMTWSGGPGHINTFNSKGLVSRNNATLNNKTGDAGMQEYYKLLAHEGNADTISQFNHPGTTFGTFADFAYWNPGYDERISLIEVGNGAGAVGSSAYFPSYEYYTQALDKGWHLAPTNNQDNHSANWGNANTARTVIITDDFSEEGMLEGMRNMTMYSTEDKNLEIMYTVNDAIMGSVIEKQETVWFDAQISDPDGESVGTVEIVVNGGRVIYQEEFAESSIDITAELNPDYSYYFLRVIQPDKDIAVTAPVWVGEVVKIGITEMTTETVMPVKGEQLTFETKLYNYENSPLVINRLEYSIGHLNRNKEIASYSDAGSISPGTDQWTHTQTFMPDALGFMTMTVKIDATLGGTPYNFEKSYKFEVLDPDNLVSIAVDGGHGNFYVSGNYADSDTGLMELGAKSGIRVVRLQEGELTYDNLQDKELLILTVPYLGVTGGVGTPVTQYLYTADELAAIARYAQNGGNIIVCSKSDRLEPAAENEKASVISNGILKAIGSETEVLAGIIVDDLKKSNELYRITLGGDTEKDRQTFNYAGMAEHELVARFLKDVEETTNNTFSAYNSAPIKPGPGAQPLVSGFPESTWATHFSELPSNTSLPPDPTIVASKGDTHLMTVEELSGGGFLIVAGVTFFSTFEVQVELDYAGQLQNTNYQILYNIFDQIAPEPVITNIADLHKAEEGLPFTIEGVATSNASGYDKETAFFDCIYVQDETQGINVFPVSEDIRAGQTLRISGYTSSYEGERQLEVKSIEVIDSSLKTVRPVSITTAEAARGDYMGSLVKVRGTVTSLTETEGAVETIMLRDSSGVEARVFINGYITADKEIKNLAVGATFEAIGLGSADPNGNRIRVRDRDEVTRVTTGGSSSGGNSSKDISDGGITTPESPGENVSYQPEAKVENGIATVTVDSNTAANLVNSAVENNSAEIIIAPTVNGDADKVEITVPKTLLSQTASQTGASLAVESSIAAVKLPNGVLAAVASESGTNVTIAAEQTEANTVKIQIAVDDKPLTSIGDGIIATVPAGADPGTVAVLVHPDGTEEVIVKSALHGGKLAVLLAGSAEIKVVENSKSFRDLPASHWAYNAVAFASSRNLFQGVSEDSFAPEASMTRGMLVTVLHRLENEDPAPSQASFADVDANAWYNKAVSWASSNHIVAGVGGNSFAPEQPISRSELVAMLYRYAQTAGLDVTASRSADLEGGLSGFSDAGTVPEWAEDAFVWATGEGIISGSGQGLLLPTDNATRAEVSSILERMVKLMIPQ